MVYLTSFRHCSLPIFSSVLFLFTSALCFFINLLAMTFFQHNSPKTLRDLTAHNLSNFHDG